nr:hypothetical protein [PVC group bacterium]
MSPWFLPLTLAGLALTSSGNPLPNGKWEAHGLPIESKRELQRFLAGSYERRETVGGSVLIMHAGSSGTMFWLDFEHDVIGVILAQTQRSRGHKMPEPEKKISKDDPGFVRVVKGKVDGVFGWS